MPGSGNTGRSTAREGKGVRLEDEPATTISTLQGGGTMPRAFLVDSAGYVQGSGDRVPVCRNETEPSNTIVANHARRPMRAILLDGRNSGHSTITTRQDDEPSFCLTNAAKAYPPAFLVGSHYSQPNTVEHRRVQVRDADEPSFTITAGHKGDKRAWLDGGRIVQLTPRALARLQSIPDEYRLPESNVLACYIIGNAVPPQMYRKIIAQFQL